MKIKNYFLNAGIIFGVAGILHLLRSIFSWKLIIENYEVPLYFSYIAVILLALMTFFAFKLYNK